MYTDAWNLAQPGVTFEALELLAVGHALRFLAFHIRADVSAGVDAVEAFALDVVTREPIVDAFHVCCPFITTKMTQ
jgi:hypothetical protein